jgi:hypothetical protein
MRAIFLAVTIAIVFISYPNIVHTRSNNSDDERERRFELISINNAGAQGDNDSDRPSISADGRSADRPFGFEIVAGAITPDTASVALLTRADLRREQDVGFFAADVYVVDTHRQRQE